MAKVITGVVFGGKKPELVYECINCNGQTFWVDGQGTITCKACKACQLPPQEWIDKAVENLSED